MANYYGNTHIGGRSIFAARKVRSNKGVKRGPRKARVVAPGAVIQVNNGGVAHVHVAKPRPNGYGNTTIGGKSIFATRKVRSNKGVKRGTRTGTKANIVRKRQMFAHQLGLKRVPPRGLWRNKINAAVRNGHLFI